MNPILSKFLNLGNILNKIAGLGFNRKVFNYQKSDVDFVAENSSRNTFHALGFFGILSTFISSPLMIFDARPDLASVDILIGLVAFPILGILGFRKLLWLIRGKEKLRIEKGKLTIEKTGTFWTRKKVYEVAEIKNIKSKYETDRFLSQKRKLAENTLAITELNRIYSYFTIGEIEFDFRRKRVRVFNDLDNSERDLLIHEIKNWVQLALKQTA